MGSFLGAVIGDAKGWPQEVNGNNIEKPLSENVLGFELTRKMVGKVSYIRKRLNQVNIVMILNCLFPLLEVCFMAKIGLSILGKWNFQPGFYERGEEGRLKEQRKA